LSSPYKKFKLFVNTRIAGAPWSRNNITPAYYVAIIIISFIIINISFALNEKWHENTNSANPGIMSNYLGVAITSNGYGQKGYIGYKEVRNILRDSGQVDNNVFQRAMTISNPRSNDIYSMGSMGIGYVDYCRFAFFLFGIKVSSLLFLYLFIFCISILLFYTNFRRIPLAKVLLMLYLVSHYVAISTIPNLSHDSGVVYNPRLIPMLAILPLIHLCLSVWYNSKGIYAFIAVFLQSLIIVMVCHIRSNALWMILFVFSFLIFYVLLYLFKSFRNTVGSNFIKTLDKIIIIKLFSKYWLLTPVLCLFVIFKLSNPFTLDPIYKSSPFNGKSHAVWSAIFNGLALHPDIRKEYVGEREFTFDINKNNYYKSFVDCADIIHNDNIVKGIIRKTICDRPELILYMSKLRFNFLQMVTYEADDQNVFSAGFNWLHINGMNEYQVFNFDTDEPVNFINSFTWFENNNRNKSLNLSELEIKNYREFDWDTDYNFGEIEKIHYNIVLDVVRTHPLKVVKLIFIIKPLQYMFMYADSFFMRILGSLPIVMFCFVLFTVCVWESISNDELNHTLIFFSIMFLFSVSPYMITYPGRHVMFDQVVLLYIGIYFLLIRLFKYIISKYNIIFKFTPVVS